VVTSDWYRALFPNMRLAKDTETECVTTKGGGRFAVPVGGSFTGRGADVIIVDDPMKAGDAQSENARRTLNDWYGTTLLSRLDDKGEGAIPRRSPQKRTRHTIRLPPADGENPQVGTKPANHRAIRRLVQKRVFSRIGHSLRLRRSD
jgi:hypothetical protein